MNSSLLTCRDRCLKQLKYRSHKAQNISSGEMASHIFENYNNAVQPRGLHIYNNDADMSMATMSTFTSKHHGLMHW